MPKKDSTTFEESLEHLKLIVDKVQNGNRTLNEMVEDYREGVNAAKLCFTLLHKAESDIQEITAQLDNILKEEQGNDKGLSNNKETND